MTTLEVHHLVDSQNRLSDPTLAPAKSFVWSSPCIRIGFFFDLEVSNKEKVEITYDTAWALLDTGADGIYVDHALIQKFNCPIAQGGENMTVNALETSRAYRGSLFVIEQARVLDMWVMARDFRREKRPFDIVLGRRFLQFCDLRWNGPSQSVILTIGQNGGGY
ncbi:MAG: hypothetical protein KUA43_18010 [Hoeflea sp.]|uniref:hypothetical protein n=1 Tax=Hoeflea sp. TaxID=1940281 RepID=UPI001D38973A|nr:hypothetical protein [Hoeflea sp.]MBU4529171.1 hypothetical protein [Alphaproteobacteria bacterium]MBU4543576.1 hypothetical protein [Alphaproteobacteria bacterium]MBU4549201.1 hypothetical protein [Alphaproteobacteria bacterium]MBV1725336.1 hypothetical protein [Hoeflea sp.]MBV1785297.1 hypothetical protein [Hoeflea sp.]